MSDNHTTDPNRREDFRRANAAGRTLAIRLIAAAFVLYMLWEIIQGYLEGGPEAPSLTMLLVAVVLLGGGAIAVAATSYRNWKRDKAAAQMTEEEIARVEALRAGDKEEP